MFLKHMIDNKGTTVTLQLSPVYYIPGLSMRLLSIGEWLQQGCKLVGTKLKMAIQQGMSMSLVLYPKRPGDTIYWLTATLDNKQQSLVSMLTLFQVDYDLMHRPMGHPSKDVLSQAKRHTTNFPKDLIISKDSPIC